MNSYESAHLEVLRLTNELDFVAHVIHDKGSIVSEHFHNALELIYVFTGEGLFISEGITTVARQDELLLINPNVIHRTSCPHQNVNLLLQFPAPLLSKLIDHSDELELSLPPLPDMDAAQRQSWQRLQQAAHCLRDTLESPSQFHNLRITLYALDILDALYSSFATPRKVNISKERSLEKLRPVLEYVEQHYTQPISIREVAAIASLQPEYFCRFFKKHTGTTFLEYINTLRLSHIYSDLLNTEKPIMQVIEAHGFTNYKLFSRMFRAQFGATPREVRTRSHNHGSNENSKAVHLKKDHSQ